MGLNERKRKILKAVIDEYIVNAEPVGSNHIRETHDLGLSPATIRNEFAQLEELGYLEKTHTSSGRIPSELGYRTYVNDLMQKYMIYLKEVNQLKDEMQQRIKELEFYIRRVLDIASGHTNLTAVALTPDLRKGTISKIELLMLDANNILLILMTDTSLVKSKHIHLNIEIDMELLQELKRELNANLTGQSLEEISGINFETITNRLRGDHRTVMEILEFVYVTISELNDSDFLSSGEPNILSSPEYKDVKKAKRFLELIHDKEKMRSIISSHVKQGFSNVVIGNELNFEDISDLSMVLSTYKITESIYGVIGVIGPKRMDYQKVVSSLDYISENLNEGLKSKERRE